MARPKATPINNFNVGDKIKLLPRYRKSILDFVTNILTDLLNDEELLLKYLQTVQGLSPNTTIQEVSKNGFYMYSPLDLNLQSVENSYKNNLFLPYIENHLGNIVPSVKTGNGLMSRNTIVSLLNLDYIIIDRIRPALTKMHKMGYYNGSRVNINPNDSNNPNTASLHNLKSLLEQIQTKYGVKFYSMSHIFNNSVYVDGPYYVTDSEVVEYHIPDIIEKVALDFSF